MLASGACCCRLLHIGSHHGLKQFLCRRCIDKFNVWLYLMTSNNCLIQLLVSSKDVVKASVLVQLCRTDAQFSNSACQIQYKRTVHFMHHATRALVPASPMALKPIGSEHRSDAAVYDGAVQRLLRAICG